MKKKLSGLSLRRDNHYVRNLIVVLGVVFVRKGLWNIIDMYFFPSHPFAGNVLSICIGLAILYLPDGSLEQLGGYKKNKKDIEKNLE